MFGRARKLRQAFEKEALPHAGVLYGTAVRLTRNERDAEDLVQDTLLRAYRFWDRFEPGTNCKAWLFKILTNTFINRYHKGRRDRELAQQTLLAQATLIDEAVARQTAPPADPGLSDDVIRALESLPPEFRIPVLLCDVEGLSYREIADAMECPVGTVMSRLYRARRQLQKQLHDYAVEQGIVREGAPLDAPMNVIDLERARKERQS